MTPETGRFVNADNVSVLNETMEELNGINLYAYCYNNPVNMIDQDGNLAGWIIALIIGAVVGAAVVGTTVGIIAHQNGDRGWELARKILIGIFVGAAIGAIVAMGIYFAPVIGSFLKMGFTFGGQMLATTTGEIIKNILFLQDVFYCLKFIEIEKN